MNSIDKQAWIKGNGVLSSSWDDIDKVVLLRWHPTDATNSYYIDGYGKTMDEAYDSLYFQVNEILFETCGDIDGTS